MVRAILGDSDPRRFKLVKFPKKIESGCYRKIGPIYCFVIYRADFILEF